MINVKLIQFGLNKHYKQNLVIDGDAGKNTMLAINAVSLIPLHWNNNRKLIGFIQVYALIEGFNAGPIDGYTGPQTEYAIDQILYLNRHGIKEVYWRVDERATTSINTTSNLPLHQYADLVKYYGAVGTNQTKITLPHPVRLAWDTKTKINKFTCHEKVADSLLRVITNVLDHYGPAQYVTLGLDLWAGCLSIRKTRGGTEYSTHAFGISCDWDSARNRLRWRNDRANFAKPVYDKWWELWEEEQWLSLGREKNYDWMHVGRYKIK